MWNAEGKMWNGNTVGRSCATVGKMRKFAYVGDRTSHRRSTFFHVPQFRFYP